MRILACAEEEILSLFVMAVASLLELLFILSASSPLIYPHYTCMYLFSVSKKIDLGFILNLNSHIQVLCTPVKVCHDGRILHNEGISN